ncbi:hypothetical protein [Bacillus suaedae]|uniref:Lipoprotein n=1 Tax=Halalkalibacter suaedae TaxID=2822140 RepID=A0A941AN95_9BACI|nr:hypothetical protein [Bacillus suaedae]MBP3950067.1 hypothetical protein [Bacillus suaedae]
MKVRIFLPILIIICFILTGCGDQTLVVRTPLEGDSYIRNNIQELNWPMFSTLISKNSNIQEDDFLNLQQTLTEFPHTRYILVKDELFRFNPRGQMLYYTDWIEEDGYYKLDLLEFPRYGSN